MPQADAFLTTTTVKQIALGALLPLPPARGPRGPHSSSPPRFVHGLRFLASKAGDGLSTTVGARAAELTCNRAAYVFDGEAQEHKAMEELATMLAFVGKVLVQPTRNANEKRKHDVLKELPRSHRGVTKGAWRADVCQLCGSDAAGGGGIGLFVCKSCKRDASAQNVVCNDAICAIMQSLPGGGGYAGTESGSQAAGQPPEPEPAAGY